MSRAAFQGDALKAVGVDVEIAPNATIEVRNASTGNAASITLDRDGNDPETNPFNADAQGRFLVYVLPGRYRVTITDNGNVRTIEDVALWADAHAIGTDDGEIPLAEDVVLKGEGPLLAEQVVTGSAVTSITFNDLDIAAHKSYRIELEMVNTIAATTGIRMHINNDTTEADYSHQIIQGAASDSISARNNGSSNIGFASSESRASLVIELRAIRFSGNRIIYATSVCVTGPTNTLIIRTTGWRYSPAVANVTRLDFTTSESNAFGVGSAARVYRGDV